MSSSKSEADLRVKVLNVLKQFKEPFDAKAFKKAYKREYEEKFSSGELPTRDYLMSFREISYNEEDDNFMFSRKEVKVEEESSSSDDEGSDDAPEVREEVNERVRDDEQCWYNKEEFRRLVRSLMTELEKNPDPAVSEEDINLFVKLHLLRNISLGVVAKIIQKSSDSPPFFYLKDFSREWKVSQKNYTVPCDLLGLTLCGFFKSFLHMQKQGNGRFAISGEQDGAVDSSAAKSVAGKIIDDGKKEVLRQQNEKKKAVGLVTEESKRAESALRHKVLSMASTISKHSSVDGLHFCVSDLSQEWQSCYGEKLIPCAQFGFNGLTSYLESIPELHRITKKKFAISPSRLEFNSNFNRPTAAKAATKKVLNERKKIDSGNMVETAEPKTGIKEKKKSMEMEKHGRKSTIEVEPRKKRAVKRSHSPDIIVLDDNEPSVKVPKQEIQDAKETRLVGEEDLAKMAMPAYKRTSSRGQGARMSGDGAMAKGSEGKVLPPLNMMDPSSSFMPPAPGFPMPGVPPLFCPTTQQQLNLSNGGVAALFMAQLLDNAEKKGMDVDAIALEAIQLIKKKMNSEK